MSDHSAENAVKLYGNRFLTEDPPDGPFPAGWQGEPLSSGRYIDRRSSSRN